MRICLLTPELPPYVSGGIATYVLELARGYGARGHDVTVAGFRIHPEPRLVHDWGISLSFGGGTPHDYFAPIQRLLPFVWRLSALWNPCSAAIQHVLGAWATRRFLRGHTDRFDIVEIPNWPGHGGMIPRPRHGPPFVVRLSTPARDSGVPAGRLASWLEARSCRRANLVVANSQAMLAKASVTYGLDPAQITVIHHGLPDIERIDESPKPDYLDVLYIGRAEPRKGVDLLIRALAVLMPEYSALRFTAVGCDLDTFTRDQGGELHELWKILRHRYPDRLTVTGRVNEAEKNRRLASAHWLVVPSRFESFCLVAVEAMRVGTPVLAADVGGLSEVARLGPGNLRFAHSDAVALVDTLRLVCGKGPGHALGLRDATRAAYLDQFRADQMVERSLEMYANLVGALESPQGLCRVAPGCKSAIPSVP